MVALDLALAEHQIMGGVVCHVSCVVGGVRCAVCGAVCFVCFKLLSRQTNHFFLLSPGVAALVRLALAGHSITVGCAGCGVVYAVRRGRANPVWDWFVA